MASLLTRRRGLDDAGGRPSPRSSPIRSSSCSRSRACPTRSPHLPARALRVGDRVAGQGHRRDARLGGPPPGRRLPRDPAPVRPDDRRPRDPRRAARPRARGRADPRLRGRRRRRRARGVPRRPVAAAGDDRARPSVHDASAARPIRRATRTSRMPRSPRRWSTRRRMSRTSRPRWTSTRRPSAAGSGRGAPRGSSPNVVVGVPGVADPQKLLSIAARIGVKDAKRFLVKNVRFVTGMARSGGFYKPTGFVEDLAPLFADPIRPGDRPPPVHVQRRRGDRVVAPGDARRSLATVTGETAALVETFARFPARLAAAAKARVAEWRPIPDGEWAPAETVRHLIAVEDEVHQRGSPSSPGRSTRTGPGPSPARRPASKTRRCPGPDRVRRRAGEDGRHGPRASTTPAGPASGRTRRTAVLDVAGLLRLATDHDERAPRQPRRHRELPDRSNPTRTLVLVLDRAPDAPSFATAPCRVRIGPSQLRGRSGVVDRQ